MIRWFSSIIKFNGRYQAQETSFQVHGTFDHHSHQIITPLHFEIYIQNFQKNITISVLFYINKIVFIFVE